MITSNAAPHHFIRLRHRIHLGIISKRSICENLIRRKRLNMKDSLTSPSDAHEWRGIFRIGAIAAIIVVLFIPIQGTIFAIWPLPKTVPGWFELFQKNKFIGLLDMDLLLIVDYILSLIV